MKNPTRYSKGGKLLDLENQRNHYKAILQPRKSMHISQQSRLKLDISLNQNKYEKNLRKSIQMENQRLYKALYSIRNGKGIMQMMEVKAIQQGKNRKKTLNNQYKLLERKQQLRKGNERIVSKLCHVKPRIGNTQQWNEHSTNFQKNMKQISRATQNVFDAKDFTVDKNQQLKVLFRQTIDFRRSRTSKDGVKRHTTFSRSKKKDSKNNRRPNDESLEQFTQQQQVMLKKQTKIEGELAGSRTQKREQIQKLPKLQEQKAKQKSQIVEQKKKN